MRLKMVLIISVVILTIPLFVKGDSIRWNIPTSSATDTNASTICSGSEVLYGNGSCGEVSASGSGDNVSWNQTFGDERYIQNDSNARLDWLNISQNFSAKQQYSYNSALPYNWYDDGSELFLNVSMANFNIESENSKIVLYNEPNAANDYKVFEVFSKEGSSVTEFIVTKAGDYNASYFARSLMIGVKGYDCRDYFGFIDCRTDFSGADLGIPDDIQWNGTAFAAAGKHNISDNGSVQSLGNATYDTYFLYNGTPLLDSIGTATDTSYPPSGANNYLQFYDNGDFGSSQRFNYTPASTGEIYADNHDGGSRYISANGLSDDLNTSYGCMMAWINVDTSGKGWLHIRDDANNNIAFYRSTGSNTDMKFKYKGAGDTDETTKTGINDDTWYHMVICWEADVGNDKLTAWVDGVNFGNVSGLSSWNAGPPNKIEMLGNTDSGVYGDGFIDEVMFFNQSLHHLDIEAIYNAGRSVELGDLTPNASNSLISWYSFDNDDVTDERGLNDGTNVNGITLVDEGATDAKFEHLGDSYLYGDTYLRDNDKDYYGNSGDVSVDFNGSDWVFNAEVGTPNVYWNGFASFFIDTINVSNIINLLSVKLQNATSTTRSDSIFNYSTISNTLYSNDIQPIGGTNDTQPIPDDQQETDMINSSGTIYVFHFDSNTSDTSGSGHTATAGGSPSSRHQGIVGSSTYFGGSGSITLDNTEFPQSNATICFWFNISSSDGSGGRVIGSDDATGTNAEIRTYDNNNGLLAMIIGNGSATTSGQISSSRDAWNNGCWTWGYNGTGTVLLSYQNGTLDDTDHIGGQFSAQDTSWWIGRWGASYLVGLVDDFAVWNRTLSAKEIADLYQAQTTKGGIKLTTSGVTINKDGDAEETLDVYGGVQAHYYTTISDRELKSDISVLDNSSDRYLYSYTMDGVTQTGLMADEIGMCAIKEETRIDNYCLISQNYVEIGQLRDEIALLKARIEVLEKG